MNILKLKCGMSVSNMSKSMHKNNSFQTGFYGHSPDLPLDGKTDSSASNSHHWLSECCLIGWLVGLDAPTRKAVF